MTRNTCICLLVLFVFPLKSFSNKPLLLEPGKEVYSLREVLTGTDEDIDIMNLERPGNQFFSLSKLNSQSSTHWLRLSISNPFDIPEKLYLAIPFSDYVSVYSFGPRGKVIMQNSGDLFHLSIRPEKTGQIVMVRLLVPAKKTETYYINLKSVTPISQQFKAFTLKSATLYTSSGFEARFEKSRTIQAFFYGAIVIMLLYNLFIFFSLRYKSYFTYVLFIFFLILFLASNQGYLLEFLWPEHPRGDLYLRFISAPLLICSFLIFSKFFIDSAYAPSINKTVNYLLIYFSSVIFLMICGMWFIGRSLVIAGALISFVLVLVIAVKAYRKGYSPAGYFLAANALLLIGGIVYAMQRVGLTIQNPLTTYSLQIASVIQLSLFSIGLAARINLIAKELAGQKLANVRLENQREIEKKKIIEEKNKELEIKVEERTESLQQRNIELSEAQEFIKEQNEELAAINSGLEEIVKRRTAELNKTNADLEQSNKELDLFIYRTSHDIKGPLARLMGLCQVGLMEVQEPIAVDYLQRLNLNARNLNHILSRLSAVYQINTLDVSLQPVSIASLIKDVLEELSFYKEFDKLNFNINIEEGLNFNTDAKLIKFILLNVVENAIKFQKQDSGINGFVSIEIHQTTSGIYISVTDNGIGISEEDAPNIFDMFSKAALKHNAAGLGLYIVKISVIKLMGTLVRAKDPEGNTQINIELPFDLIK